MTEPKKLTTAEILALARQKKAESDAAQSNEPSASPPESTPAQDSPVASESAAPPPSPPQAPKTTAEILAAARAAKGTTPPASTPVTPTAPASTPKSTAEILAAARAAKGSAPAAPAEQPKSTADILAAARAAKGGTATPSTPASEASAAGAPAAASSAPSSEASKDRPDIKEMVAAVKAAHEGKPPVLPKPAPALPKLPEKDKGVSRRSAIQGIATLLMSPFIVAWVAMGAIAGAWTLGIARFMMPNMVLELPSKFKVGPPSDFPPGTVSEKFKASRGVYIVHSSQYDGRDLIYGLLSVCTHLGCTPNWLEGEQKFKCPCHGSGFYITGINFEGPAPRPLERVGLRRAEDGMLEVDKSLKFQEELGQWADPKSYYVNS